YAVEQLAARGEADALRQRHAAYYLQMAETAAPHLKTANQLIWLAQLESEHANIRAALQWCLIGGGEKELGLRLAGAAGHFWWLHNHYSEGRRWLELALELGDSVPKPLRAQALHYASGCTIGLSDHDQGIAWATEALAIYQELGDTWHMALALCLLG